MQNEAVGSILEYQPYTMQSILRKWGHLFARPQSTAPPVATQPTALSEELYGNYAFVIGSLFSYFNEMPAEQQHLFVQRAHEFRSAKKFHFIGLERHDEKAMLVSAAAIQVTFGLDNYMLNHFSDIYILADAYQMENDDELFIGHVAPEGIYLSWKHFLYGYTVRNDNVNVAVHEMAHALLYSNFFAQYGTDRHFRHNYEKFSTSTGPILAEAITSRHSYLRSYAFSNLHEFWAVSVEAFFENPAGLKENMPELYTALSRVLNQDPMLPQKRLS